jgi:hypothetical protein
MAYCARTTAGSAVLSEIPLLAAENAGGGAIATDDPVQMCPYPVERFSDRE